jgi:hypothetical protein
MPLLAEHLDHSITSKGGYFLYAPAEPAPAWDF